MTLLLSALHIGCETPETSTQSSEPIAADKKAAEDKPAESPKAPASARSDTTPQPDPAETATTPTKAEDLARFTSGIAGEGDRLVATIKTSMGEFHCELYEDRAPLTVANFVGLARGLKAWKDPESGEVKVGESLYAGSIFHRVIPNFMIQGGDPAGTGRGNPGYRIPDEFGPGLKHDKPGLLSMANAGPNTGGSQFFLTEVPTPNLDGRHAIFGACEEIDLVKKIARVPRGRMDRPETPVTIEAITFAYKK